MVVRLYENPYCQHISLTVGSPASSTINIGTTSDIAGMVGHTLNRPPIMDNIMIAAMETTTL